MQTKTKTSFSLGKLTKALEAEHRADMDRASAEDAWRKSWWATTWLLAECPAEDWPTARDAYVDNIGSASVASDRRRTGQRLPLSALTEGRLPGPRMAQAASSTLGGKASDSDTAEMVAKLYAAEDEGLTLREFSQQITGRSWTKAPEDLTKADEDAILARIAAKRPEALAAAVAESPAAMGHVEDEKSRRRASRPSPSGTEADGVDTRWMDTSSLLGDLAGIASRIRFDVEEHLDVWRADPSLELRLRESALRLVGYADAVKGLSDDELVAFFAEEAS